MVSVDCLDHSTLIKPDPLPHIKHVMSESLHSCRSYVSAKTLYQDRTEENLQSAGHGEK